MPSPTIHPRFGRIVCDDEVENEIITCIEAWILAYQAEIERQRGWDPRELAAPFSVIPVTLLERQPEDAFPCVAVAASRSDAASASGDHESSATWYVTVTVFADGADEQDTRKRVAAHVAAVRELLTRQLRGGALISDNTRPATEYAPLIQASGRYAGGGNITLTVTVDSAFSELPGGMLTPPVDPYAVPSGLGTVEAPNVQAGVM